MKIVFGYTQYTKIWLWIDKNLIKRSTTTKKKKKKKKTSKKIEV
jgi:hypothetical protein